MTKYGDFTALRDWLMDIPLRIKAKTGDEMNSGARSMYEMIIERLDCAPEFDVVEVKHGRWLELTVPPHWIYCSECNKVYVLDKDLIGKMCTDAEFCPHGGAIMDGKVD